MAAASEKGARLATLFQSLEKYSSPSSNTKMSVEEVQSQLRNTTSKIVQHLQSQEKGNRDQILKNQQYMTLMLTVLENTADYNVQENIVSILTEILGKTSINKRAGLLVSHGTTHTLFQTLSNLNKDSNAPNDLILAIHHLLAKIGARDRKFGIKARLLQAMPVTLQMVKSTTSDPYILQPVLPVLKLLSNNAVNASYLGKNGAVSHLLKILSSCGKKHTNLVKVALECLHQLVKSKSNAARAIGQGAVPIVLNLFSDCHRTDIKNRQIPLRKCMLKVLKNLSNLKAGQQALSDSDGLRLLYMVCCESSEVPELESLIIMASVILRKCFPPTRLPLTSLRSSITCSLPQSAFHTIDMGEGPDSDTTMPSLSEARSVSSNPMTDLNTAQDLSMQTSPLAAVTTKKQQSARLLANDLDSETSEDSNTTDLLMPPAVGASQSLSAPSVSKTNAASGDDEDENLDHDDDVSSDGDDADGGAAETRELEEVLHHGPYMRDWDDLAQYKEFFPERTEFEHLQDISTGPVQFTLGGGPSSNVKMDTTELANGLEQISVRVENRSASLSTSRSSSTRSTTAHGGMAKDASWPFFLTETTPAAAAAAVNLQTGSKVFSLDNIGPSSDTAAPLTSVGRFGIKTNPVPPKTLAALRGRSMPAREAMVKRTGRSMSTKTMDEDSGLPRTTNPSYMTNDAFSSLFGAGSTAAASQSTTNTDEISPPKLHDRNLFMEIASKTKSVGHFNKVSFPDYYGTLPPPFKEPMFSKPCGLQRAKIFEDIERFVHPEALLNEVIYDLDQEIDDYGFKYTQDPPEITNKDSLRVLQTVSPSESLKFNAQFESGNLRKVIKVRDFEYDLILNPDINTNHHHQWFYFEVSNMEEEKQYRFNIVNCEKVNSQFNFGMKPVVYSVRAAMEGSPYWTRDGSEISYYRNHFVRSAQTTGGTRGKTYFTATFTMSFKYSNDVCYVAYHYPYTFSLLQYHLHGWEQSVDPNTTYFLNQKLTDTIQGNPLNLLTITAMPTSMDAQGLEQLKARPYIFLSARVHPGESNASWVMKGTIDYLLSGRAHHLREQYIFKIVPMLNPDGVINGNHRCSLVAEDLNRRWYRPCPKLHPTIYHSKGLLQYLHMYQLSPLVFCDYHGHSRRKNVFLYGCSPFLSWVSDDMDNPGVLGPKLEDQGYKALPRLLDNLAPSFHLGTCSYVVEKVKETSARVVVWRQMRVLRSYTMESTYCGCDQGPYKGCHISTRELEEMGQKFCEALLKVRSRHGARPSKTTAVPSTVLSSEASESVTEPAPGPSHSDSDGDLDDDVDDDDDDDDLEGSAL